MATSQQTRQSQLFAAEDWQTIYTAFTTVNFNAYDFNTIRSAMVNYIRLTYPESFNDWIESDEFVAIIDLLAYLGQSLAFRSDLNTRENFLDTATRRSSVFRLARMLSYQPQRALPANGLVKISQIVTNQDLYDSSGINLNNTPIIWNDQNNPDWFEQFIVVLNATLNSANIFGNPSKSGTVANIATELYNMNNTSVPSSVIPFSINLSGNAVAMELANVDFNVGTTTNILNSGNFFEIHPDPLNSWSVIYRNDGNGYSSVNTGFFFFFKQGSMGFKDYLCDFSIANRVIDVNADNVNQTDVWVQNIQSNGLVNTKWDQVPSVNGFNVIYNSLDQNIRNIYSVISRDNNGIDQISIRFADGNFGNVPVGLMRVWYRSSNNLTYQIKPSDIANQVFAFNYLDNLNNTWSVAFTTNLQTVISNAQSSEGNFSIAQNAPQVYYTQDRMVNGEDYNLFPLQNGQVLKVNAINRVYSGQSRYLDINDPTGNYNDLNVFCTDGRFYSEDDLNLQEIIYSPSMNLSVAVSNQIQPLVNGSFNNQTSALELNNFYYKNYPNVTITPGYTWQSVTSMVNSCTGGIFYGVHAVQIGNNVGAENTLRYIRQGSLVTFTSGKKASVIGIIGEGTGVNLTAKLDNGLGAVTLSNVILSNDSPDTVIPAFRTTFTQAEISAISSAMALKTNFGIRYDYDSITWKIITFDNLTTANDRFSLDFAGSTSSTNNDDSWLLKVIWSGSSWRVYCRSVRYIFESIRQNRFYFENIQKIYDPTTGTAQLDYVNVLSINPDVNTGLALPTDYLWQITGQQIFPDGYADPTSVRVTMWQGNNYGIPDEPYEFNKIVDPQEIPERMLFWVLATGTDGYQFWTPTDIPVDYIFSTAGALPTVNDTFWTNGDVVYIINNEVFYRFSNKTLTDVTSIYKMRIGRKDIKFLWKHYAPTDQRINPAITNVIDMYVLTSAYDIDMRNWIAINGSIQSQPQPLTSAELKSQLGDLEKYKQMTDQMIWHPVSYKVIFGSQSDSEYRVQFLVVKTPNTTYTDNEVKSLVINSVNQYFSLNNWDFGQSFFFTELAAYIHQTLATIIGSIVIKPLNAQAKFGDLFEINCKSDEIFISSARVTDVQIVTALTELALGISNG